MKTTSSPLVTIGIPVYNGEMFLEDTIRSILNQTFTDYTLIIMDDGSTDRSEEIVRKFDDPRIRFISDGKNKGMSIRLNEITELSTTPFMARMDADDIMHYSRLERQMSILTDHPEIDVLGTNAYSIDEHNRVYGLRMPAGCEIIDTDKFIHPSITGKTEWFRNNLYDPEARRIEDIELWQRAKPWSVFKCLNEPLLFYREFGGEYYKKYRKGIKSFFHVSSKRIQAKDYKGAVHWFIRGSKYIVRYLYYWGNNKIGKEDLVVRGRSIPLDNEDRITEKNKAQRDLSLSIR